MKQLYTLQNLIGANADLSETAIEDALISYLQIYNRLATIIIISNQLSKQTYEMFKPLNEPQVFPGVEIKIVVVEDFPPEMWAVCGPEGMIVSEGSER